MNMFFVQQALNLDPNATKIVFLDNHPDYASNDIFRTAYSPKHPLLHVDHFQRKRVLFSKLIFHLESPAALVFPEVAKPQTQLRCKDSSLYRAYRRYILDAYGLLHVAPQLLPTVTFIVRRRTVQVKISEFVHTSNNYHNVDYTCMYIRMYRKTSAASSGTRGRS
jgi:hypothetical protein